MGCQLVFDLPHRAARGREDFLVSPSNQGAVAMIDSYPDWPHHAVAIVGPPGSGKSHLLEVWRQVSGGHLVTAAQLTAEAVPDLLSIGALAIDDAPGENLDERALFHLFNLARQDGRRVLMASAQHPPSWNVTLPDLATRLKAMPVAGIGAPDDALLRGVMVKLFTDRQLAVDEATVSYLLRRMPRSLAAARALVAEIDRRALAERAEITRVFAGKVLEELTAPGLLAPE